MRRITLAAGLLAGSLLAGPAFPQNTNFITQQDAGQWRASKLVGLDVYGTDNNKIGDVRDVLLDRSGNAQAVVIGVGGFLGIGEKNVALPYSSLEWSTEPVKSSGSASNATGGNTTANTAPRDPNATGSTAGTTASTGTSASNTSDAASRGAPDHAVLRMTKADLEKAPNFQYAGARSDSRGSAQPANSGMSSPMGGGTGTTAPAPRQ